MEKQYTTEALKENQHLTVSYTSVLESYMIGFTDGVKDDLLCGWYSNRQLKGIN